jgi:hypothetical protein
MPKWSPLLVTALALAGCKPSGDKPSPAPSAAASAASAAPRPVETVVDRGPPPDAGAGPVRFDGIYVADASIRKLLRFYADGSILTISSKPDVPYSEVIVWFRKGHPKAGTGTYALDGERVRFRSTIEGVGSVDYDGTVQPGTARLKWHSLINDAKGEDVYRFMHLPVR